MGRPFKIMPNSYSFLFNRRQPAVIFPWGYANDLFKIGKKRTIIIIADPESDFLDALYAFVDDFFCGIDPFVIDVLL
jgi:hypothetical protein